MNETLERIELQKHFPYKRQNENTNESYALCETLGLLLSGNLPTRLCVYSLRNGKQHFEYHNFTSDEVDTLFENRSVVKFGRHYWI